MNKYVLLFCISFLVFFNLNAQIEGSEDSRVIAPDDFPSTYKEFKNQEARKYIELLKENGLIVVIDANYKKIKNYERAKSRGAKKVAAKIKEKVAIETRDIITAFKKHYTFSDYYFTYNHLIDSLKNGVKSGIFLNDSAKIDESIILKSEFYLFFDKSYILNEHIPSVFKKHQFEIDKSASASERNQKYEQNETVRKDVPFSSAGSGGETYVIKNWHSEQLRFPFPVYTKRKILRGLPFEIDLFNVRLERLYTGNPDFRNDIERIILTNKIDVGNKKKRKTKN